MRGTSKGHCTSFLFAVFIGIIILFVTSCFKNEARVRPFQSSFRNVLPRSNWYHLKNEILVDRSQNATPPLKLVARAGETETKTSTYAKLVLPRFPRAIPNVFVNDIPVSEYKNPLPTFLHNPKSGGTTIKKCLVSMADDSDLTITPFLWREARLNFEEDLLNGLYDGDAFDLVAGDVSMGTCQRMPTFRPCAYYTIVREPYDRAISQYFFCRGGGETAGSCKNKTVEEYVADVGSLFLRQLTYETTCRRLTTSSDRIEASDRPWRCTKSRQRRFSEQDRQRLINYLIQKMESIFAVVGITEEFEQSLELFQDALNLSFYDTCRDYKFNVGPVDSKTETSQEALQIEKLEAKRTLLANPEIRKALQPDILLYEKAKQIFEKQKEIYFRKKKNTQQ